LVSEWTRRVEMENGSGCVADGSSDFTVVEDVICDDRSEAAAGSDDISQSSTCSDVIKVR